MKIDKFNDAIGNIKDEYIKEAHEKEQKKKIVINFDLIGKLATGLACILLIALVIPNLFTRFSMGSMSDYKTMEAATATEEYAYDIEMENGYAVPKESMTGGTGGVGQDNPLTQNKKMILTSNLSQETLDLDKTIEALNQNVNKYGGYFQSTSINNNGAYRFYEAIIRIPADKYNDFISETKKGGNNTFYNEEVKDVTDTYTDIEARLASLKAEEEKVLEFYKQATNIEELMSIENRLSDIRYEIDSYENSKKNYDLLITYSTLNISIRETKAYSLEDENFVDKIKNAFKAGWSNFVNGLKDLTINIVYNIWAILALVIVVIIIVIVIKKIRSKKNK